MKGTCVFLAAWAMVANCSAVVKPSPASGSLVPRASSGFSRAWSSGADTGIVIVSLGADSGAGASTAAGELTRAARVTRFALAGCGVGAAGSSATCAATAAGSGVRVSRPEVISDPIHTPSASPPTRPRAAAEVLAFIWHLQLLPRAGRYQDPYRRIS